MDITEVILEQHHEQRRAFAVLDEMPRDLQAGLAAIWGRLEVLLEVHAEADERFFYPHLLRLGKDNPEGVVVDEGEGDVEDEVEDAIKEHNERREAIREARRHETGSKEWWTAVWEARKANDDHMAEEEREDLLDFRHHADLQTRHDIAVQFLTFQARHYESVPIRDKDPEAYVKQFG